MCQHGEVQTGSSGVCQHGEVQTGNAGVVQHGGASTGRTGMCQQGSTWVLMGWYDPNLALFSGAG